MQLPLQITFRHMEPSPAVEAKVRERADKLDRLFGRIMACRVAIEAPHQHHHQGTLYQVRVDLTVPGDELVASRDAGLNHGHEDVYVALRDAFDALERRLEDYARRQRQEVKTHESTPVGRISELVPADDYGRIRTPDGRDVYFHRHSVVDGHFDRLQVGDEVRFSEEQGAQGPQASTVHVLGKRHPSG
ncbi:MAG: HPF/RaiA family ribosome-associated protein [Gammaproteobacteria bacterium]